MSKLSVTHKSHKKENNDTEGVEGEVENSRVLGRARGNLSSDSEK